MFWISVLDVCCICSKLYFVMLNVLKVENKDTKMVSIISALMSLFATLSTFKYNIQYIDLIILAFIFIIIC